MESSLSADETPLFLGACGRGVAQFLFASSPEFSQNLIIHSGSDRYRNRVCRKASTLCLMLLPRRKSRSTEDLIQPALVNPTFLMFAASIEHTTLHDVLEQIFVAVKILCLSRGSSVLTRPFRAGYVLSLHVVLPLGEPGTFHAAVATFLTFFCCEGVEHLSLLGGGQGSYGSCSGFGSDGLDASEEGIAYSFGHVV
jgi:hypothetical protein